MTDEEKAKAAADEKAKADAAAAATKAQADADAKAAAEKQNKERSQADRALVDEVAAMKQALASKGILPLDSKKVPEPKRWDWGKVLDPFGMFDAPAAAGGSTGGGK